MGKQRYIDTKFWDDNYIRKFTPKEKLLYLYFLTNPLTNICGIYEISIDRIVFDTGMERALVIEILEKLKKSNRLKYSQGYVAIKRFIRHQAKNSKIRKGIETLLKKAPKGLAQWVEGYPMDSSSRNIDSTSHLNPNINFNYKSGNFEGITEEYLKELEKQYPNCYVDGELHSMTHWLMDNPKKKRQGKRSFINNWLKRANDNVSESEDEGVPRLRQGDYGGK